jgi:hypothetical protein
VRACWCSRSAEAAAAADSQDILAGLFADAIEAAGPWATTVDCLAATLESVTVVFTPERHDVAPQRRAAIAANSELQERELLKRARLASAIADALRARRADDTTAWQLMPTCQPGRRVRPLSSSHRSYRRRGR